ncbi:MAG TPA: TonB-dependent receptor, partial [Terriglobia bacterium]|nr:TonB-dependent receptor [Terriglobia bacterium]
MVFHAPEDTIERPLCHLFNALISNFGGAIGGPIRRDHTFFFFTYEGLRQSRGVTTFAQVPLDQARVDGPFVQSLGVTNGQIHPAVKPYLSFWPRANNLDDAREVSQGVGRYYYTLKPQQKDHYIQGRIDHTLTASGSLFGRYSVQDSSDHRDAMAPEISSDYPTRNQYFTLSYNHIFSSMLLGTFRGSFSRTHATAIYNSEFPRELAFQRGQPVGNLGVTGLTNPTNVSGTTSLPVELNQRIFSYSADLYYTLGQHSLKFGMLLNRYRQFLYNDGGNSPRGAWSFNSLADFLNARPNQFSMKTPGSITDRTFEYQTWGFYLQDDFRILSNLTLNLGLRYEFQTEVDEIRGNGAALRDVLKDANVTVSDPVFINPSLKNFSPRVGFAWDV